ncbi:rOK family protein [Ruminococcus sp. CAG:403]|nr:rOK family protein [Ruminococcus sp. CAG:403]
MSNSGMTTIEVKRINRSKVYQMIYEKRSISKQDLAQELHMGLTTVTQNLKALEEDGWIHRTGYYESTGGRKAQAIEIVPNARTTIGVFILKRSILLVAVDLYSNVMQQKAVTETFSATETYYQFLGKEVMRFANHVESNPDKISGVGIAIQGILSPDRSKIQYGKLLQHTGLNTADLTRYIPYPCFTEHDSKAAAFAEIWNQPQLSDAVVFLLNKNLGSALVIHGEVHQGKSMHSGTIEHMCIVPNGTPCYCGGKGCLETYCSAESLQSQIHGNSFESFFQSVRENEPKSKAIWEMYLSKLAAAIQNVNTVIDSDVILSGFLVPYLTEADLEFLKQKITEPPFFAERDITIQLGKHGEFAPAIGAALPFVKRIIDGI